LRSSTDKAIWIKRTVTVVARLTTDLRAELCSELRRDVARIDHELSRLEAHAGEQGAADAERLRRGRQQLVERLRRLQELELGAELERGKLDSYVQLGVGDRLEDFADTVLVVEDGVVVDIRPARRAGGHSVAAADEGL